MNGLVYFLGGVVACVAFILVFVLIEFWIEDCGKRRIEKLVREYDAKLDEQKAANEEHTRKCLEEQKEQIETTERKAREYQSARFAEERKNILADGYKQGFKAGEKAVFDQLESKIKSGELVVHQVK